MNSYKDEFQKAAHDRYDHDVHSTCLEVCLTAVNGRKDKDEQDSTKMLKLERNIQFHQKNSRLYLESKCRKESADKPQQFDWIKNLWQQKEKAQYDHNRSYIFSKKLHVNR